MLCDSLLVHKDDWKKNLLREKVIRYSKFLSLVLRHKPETIGIQLDQNGWANVDLILQGFKKKGLNVNFDILKEVVDTSDKKRFSFTDDFTKIRANQGHSRRAGFSDRPRRPADLGFRPGS